jgi:putative toxin-antitoxin system antitoxin component (TIGR02293 family)
MAKRRSTGIERFRQFLDRGTPGPNSYAVLLGLESLDTAGIMRVAERGIPYGAFDTLRENTALAAEDTMTLVNIPRRTLTRRKREGVFAPDESDRLLRAARVFGRTLELFDGDRDSALDWFTTPQPGLGGAVPLQMARTDIGAREIERLVGRLEHGVFS